MTRRRVNIAVVGGSAIGEDISQIAYEVGMEIALQGWTLICGGLEGVMESASKGAFENGGTTVGILPGYDPDSANKYVNISLPTGLGHARNGVIAASADGMIAIDGEYGTLSEIALGLKMGKPVVGLRLRFDIDGVQKADSPSSAVSILKTLFNERLA